jgi:chorismate mutase
MPTDAERILELERRVKRLERQGQLDQQNSPEVLRVIRERDKAVARQFWEKTTGTKSRLR